MELRVEVRPAGPFRLPRRLGMDGVTRRRGGVIERLLHDEQGSRSWCAPHRRLRTACVFGARAGKRECRARHRADAVRAGRRRRSARVLCALQSDPLIGGSLRRRPWLRVGRRPEPWEALVWAVCEQLIEYERAAAIQGRLVTRLGRRWTGRGAEEWASGLRDLPSAATLGATAPAMLESCESERRARDRAATGRARGGERARGPARRRARARLAAAAGDPGDRRVDGGDARAARAGPLRPAARGRPGAAEAGRADSQRRRPAGAGLRRRCAGDVRPYGEWAGLAAVHAAGL